MPLDRHYYLTIDEFMKALRDAAVKTWSMSPEAKHHPEDIWANVSTCGDALVEGMYAIIEKVK